MTKIPLTRVAASSAKAEAIRTAVRAARFSLGARRRIAAAEDTEAFYAFIADRRVSDPIYTLPKPVTRVSARAFIEMHAQEQTRGEGLLLLELDESGAVTAYHDIRLWPQWSAAEVGGAIHPDRQNRGAGSAGAAATFAWLFDVVGVDLVCETAALDNVRTRKLLDRLGFAFKGEIESELPGGGTRPSLYWEMTREDWAGRMPSAPPAGAEEK